MLVSATFAVLWLACGFIAVLTMLSLLGGKPDATSRTNLKWTHRIFGGLFSLGYIVFGIIMVPKYTGNAPLLSSPIAVHAYLAIILFPLLLIKHYIVRVAKRYYPALPYIGVTILMIAFVVVAVTGINHFILWTDVPKMTVQSEGGSRIVSTAVGRDLMPIKCARCHGLQLLYKERKSETAWRQTIVRMQNYDNALFITDDHIDHIVGYLLLERQVKNQG